MLLFAAPPHPAPAPPPTLPAALRRAWAAALGEASRKGQPPRLPEGLPVPEAWPEGHPQRWVAAALQAAARGRTGERVWAESVKALHRDLRALPRGAAKVERLEILADLMIAQGLPSAAYRDAALLLRIEAGRKPDLVLEREALEALKDHWGDWLEAPRRGATLAWAEHLAGLWARRPSPELAEAMAPAFQSHAPRLWEFVGRNGTAQVREQLRDLLGSVDPGDLLDRVGPRLLADWMGPLQQGPWGGTVAALWSRLKALERTRLPFGDRLSLAQAAGDSGEVRDLLKEGLLGADGDVRRTCLERLIRMPQAELMDLAEAQITALPAEDPLAKAWATERPGRSKPVPGGAPPENRGWPTQDPSRWKAWEQALEDLEEGRRGPLEAFAREELALALRAPEAPHPELLEALLYGLVAGALRERDWEGAVAHLEALEPLRRRLQPPHPKVEAGFQEVRSTAERSARLMTLLGSAAEP
ncbi:MAG TPA: hypothetical protein PKO12_00140 [Holophaga sp.]|nr:hypothetical protein [Holophaga sp.]